jgi:hypothetical protein
MVDESLPDLSPSALSRLTEGLTTDEVEAIVGHFHRPNVHDGREYFAWIGEGSMLRAFFKGPGRTLSSAVLDVQEEQRPLDLGPNRRRRMRQASVIQTWCCVPCRQRYQQPQSGRTVVCIACGKQCERPVVGVRVPSPKYAKRWDSSWTQNRSEKALLAAYTSGEVREAIRLELLDIELPKKHRTHIYVLGSQESAPRNCKEG